MAEKSFWKCITTSTSLRLMASSAFLKSSSNVMCLKVGEPRSRLMTSWLQYPESSLITTTSTFFTSIVAAHAKMNIWMTGGISTMNRLCRVPMSTSSSFRAIARIRRSVRIIK